MSSPILECETMAEEAEDMLPIMKSRQKPDDGNVNDYVEKSEHGTSKQLSFSEKNSGEEELPSLEYEEDCFYTYDTALDTPSFDVAQSEADEDAETAYWTIDPELYTELNVSEDEEDEDSHVVLGTGQPKPRQARFLTFRSGKLVRKVRLSFQEWTRFHRPRGYDKFLSAIKEKVAKARGEEPPLTITPEEGDLQGLTEEEREKQREIWQQELAKVEEEIETLKSVLKSKVRLSQELKKKLGFTVWRELSQDFSQSVKTVKETTVYQSVEEGLSNIGKAVVESPVYHSVEDKISQVGKVVADNSVYQKTESVVKATAESTKSILGGLTGGFTQKLGQIKSSESFRSLEDKVGSAYENVKTKVSSRSSSMQSFDDALREESERRAAAAGVTSPTIPEGKPFP